MHNKQTINNCRDWSWKRWTAMVYQFCFLACWGSCGFVCFFRKSQMTVCSFIFSSSFVRCLFSFYFYLFFLFYFFYSLFFLFLFLKAIFVFSLDTTRMTSAEPVGHVSDLDVFYTSWRFARFDFVIFFLSIWLRISSVALSFVVWSLISNCLKVRVFFFFADKIVFSLLMYRTLLCISIASDI